MRRISAFVKKELICAISLLLAMVSMLITPPSAAYLGYIDVDVLLLLFCLMGVVAGLRRQGAFDAAAALLLRRAGSLRLLALLLVGLCFVSSMLITNDVALLTFVPLTLSVLTPWPDTAITVVVLETVAANLGSMATPVGNPQNLYLFTHYQLSSGAFMATMAPLTILSGLLLAACCLAVPRTPVQPPTAVQARAPQRSRLTLHLALLALCLLAVLRVLPVWAAFVVVLAALLLLDRPALARVDYPLLLTFVCFFIFVGNLSALHTLSSRLGGWLLGHELLTGVLVSQVVSNVPASLMLAPFTPNWSDLLLGVNIGGLGTLVASLASLISFKLYEQSAQARPGRYFIRFTLCNVAFLAVLLGVSALL